MIFPYYKIMSGTLHWWEQFIWLWSPCAFADNICTISLFGAMTILRISSYFPRNRQGHYRSWVLFLDGPYIRPGQKLHILKRVRQFLLLKAFPSSIRFHKIIVWLEKAILIIDLRMYSRNSTTKAQHHLFWNCSPDWCHFYGTWYIASKQRTAGFKIK